MVTSGHRLELANLHAAAVMQERASLGQRDRRAEAVGCDQRVAAQVGIWPAVPDCGPVEHRVAEVDDAGAHLVEPGGPVGQDSMSMGKIICQRRASTPGTANHADGRPVSLDLTHRTADLG